MTKESLYKTDRDLIYHNGMWDEQSVARTQGISSGDVTYAQGISTFSTNGKITYSKPIYGVKSVRVIVDLDSVTAGDILQLSATHSIEYGAATLTATGFSSPTIYVDGVAGSTITTNKAEVVVTTATAFDADDFVIGYAGAYLEGSIEVVGLYSSTLSSAEVANLFSNSRHHEPVLDDTILDVSGRSGSITNRFTSDTIGSLVPEPTVTATEVVRDGEVMAMLFDGATSKVDCGNYDDLTGDKTFILWLRLYSYGESSQGRFIDNGKFICYSSNTQLRISNNGVTTHIASSINELNVWYMLVVTRTSAGLSSVYKNGKLKGAANQDSGTPVAGTSNISIGDNIATTRASDGLINDVRIVSKLLTADTISALYTSEKHKYNL